LVGSGEAGIVHAANQLLERNSKEYAAMKRPSDVFGDGRASVRIANILERLLRV
jgi:UDP-N-acetylglucosamine 2-epimerase